jgi:hypothetical protein
MGVKRKEVGKESVGAGNRVKENKNLEWKAFSKTL